MIISGIGISIQKRILKSKEYQIFKNLAEWTQLNEDAVEREYMDGQSFLYLGRNYRLTLVDEKVGEIQFIKNTFYLSKQDKHKARDFFIKFYKDKLNSKIQAIIEKYQFQLDV